MTDISVEHIEQIINEYNDPYLEMSFGEANIVQSLNVDQHSGTVSLGLAFPYPVKNFQGGVEQVLRSTLEHVPGVHKVEIQTHWELQGPAAHNQASLVKGVKHIIAVASGKGGVGKSTTAVNLALAMASEGATVGLLDADIYGPSQGMMLGVADGTRPDVKDQQALVPIKALGLQSMSMSYLVNENTPMVWRGPMVTGALQQMLNQTLWEDVDYLIVDMPPGTGDIALTLAQKVPVTGAVIVTTPQNIALLDAVKGIEMFQKVSVPIVGVIENMSTHICSQCGHEEAVFGEGGGEHVSDRYQVPLLGRLPLDASIRSQTDEGRPTVLAEPESEITFRFVEIGRRVMAGLARRALNSADEAAPSIHITDD